MTAIAVLAGLMMTSPFSSGSDLMLKVCNRLQAGEHFEHTLAGGVIGEGEAFPAFVFDPVDFEDDRSVTDDFRPLWSFCRGSLHAPIVLGFC